VSFENTSWQGLIDYVAGRGAAQHAAALIEAQRRAVVTQERLDMTLQESTRVTIEHAHRLVDLAQASGRQADEVIALTEKLRRLTVVIVWLTVVAVAIGAIQSVPLVIQFIQWSRRLVH
jgi:hypothetical protein